MSDWRAEHARYVKEVSIPEMAPSLAFCDQLWRLMEGRKPATILDLGSGFTSYLTRLWAMGETGVEVVSVDDNEEWLEKTHRYLLQRDLDGGQLILWDALPTALQDRRFDLVVYDLGVWGTRIRKMREALNHVAPGGVMLLDDMQWPELAREAQEFGKLRGFTVQGQSTPDEQGRTSAWIELPLQAKEPDTAIRPIIGIPMPPEGIPGARIFFSFIALAMQRWPFIHQEYAGPTGLARDKLVWHFLCQPQFTHILMLDADQVHPPDIVQRLGRWVKEDRSRWIVGGLNHRRTEPYEPNAYLFNEQMRPYTVPDWEPGLTKVDLLGTGCILIAREVFERMPPTWFGYSYEQANLNAYPSDDTCFGLRCRAHGIVQWCDTTTESPHKGEVWIDKDYMQRWIEQHQEKIDDAGIMKLA